jgi:hypothetical protein
MSRVEMEIVGSPEHEDHAAQKSGEGMDPPMPDPEACEESSHQNVKDDPKIQGQPQREEEVDPIGRVKQGGLESAQKRGATKIVGIPQDQMPLLELGKSEFPPSGEMQVKIGPFAGKDPATSAEQHIPEQEKVQADQAQGCPKEGTGGGLLLFACHGAMETKDFPSVNWFFSLRAK